jgi:uroporphyrin-III C-methyltransferase
MELEQTPQQLPEEILPEQPPKVKKCRIFYWLLPIIAIALALLSFASQYYFWQLHQAKQQQLSLDNQHLQQQSQLLYSQVNTQVKQQWLAINELLTRIQVREKQNTGLIVQEAEYLVRLASYHLIFEGNTELAIKLLQSADQKLTEVNDAATTQIRKALAADLTQLSTIAKPDVAGLMSRITAISDQVGTLSLLPTFNAPKEASPATQPQLLGWKEKLMATLHSLQNLITIRRVQEPAKPLISVDQQLNVVESIRLHLAQAQWAILRQDQNLYQTSLSQAKTELQKYFFRNPAASNLAQMVDGLQTVNVKPNLPDLSATLNLFHT